MKGLILAAGRGERLRCAEIPKPLVLIEGTTLIERVIDIVLEGGLEGVCVVTGYQGDVVKTHLRKLAVRRKVEIETLHNRDWMEGSASSFLAARSRFSEPFLLIMGDHLFDPSPVQRIRERGLVGMDVVLAVDRRSSEISGEATVALTREDRIVALGKELEEYNAVDTGIFLCAPPLFNAVDREMGRGRTTMSGGVNLLAGEGRAGAVDLGDVWWVDVDDPADLADARRHYREGALHGDYPGGALPS